MLSVIIPSRNEELLEKTIESVLKAAQGEIEVIAVLDGDSSDINIQDDRLVLIYNKEAIGQRQSINKAARIAKGEYIMKLDAHCTIAPGFDIILARDCEYDMTMIPRMYNLDVETWQPKYLNNFRVALRKRKVHDYMYIGMKDGYLRTLYYPHEKNKELHQNTDMIVETMSCMGPCFFMYKKRFWELGGCDEQHGGWGQQGIELACKAWLSGGRLVTNKNTWFAHWFRGGGVPKGFKQGATWPMKQKDVNKARDYSTDLWMNNKWPQQKYPFKWLLDKFKININESDLTIIYLTANKTPDKWKEFHKEQLLKASNGYPIISVSKQPIDIGFNIIDIEESNYWNIYRQILRASKIAETNYIAIAEDDTLYSKEHFSQFRPNLNEVAYNRSRWSVFSWGEPIYSLRNRVSNCSMIGGRDLVIDALQERIDKYPNNNPPLGFVGEIGRHKIEKGLGVTKRKSVEFYSKVPIIQLSHPKGLEERQQQQRKSHAQIRAYDIPYWGKAEWIQHMMQS